jgi:hypothetical protein
MRRSLIIDTLASSCYFRTSVEGDGRKALIQITERCNLHCAHCFVSSGDWGEHMSAQDFAGKVLPRLLQVSPSLAPGQYLASTSDGSRSAQARKMSAASLRSDSSAASSCTIRLPAGSVSWR